MSRRGVWIARMLLLSFSLLFVAAVGEVGLRIIKGPPIIWRFPQESYDRDPRAGHRLRPDQSAFTHDEIFKTNEHGLRVGETDESRVSTTAVRRILALGDSQTAGDGVRFEDTWPRQLEKRLSRSPALGEAAVFNAGVSGYAPWQYAIALREHAPRLGITDVVVAIYVNDVTPRPKNIDAYVVTNSTSRRILYVLKRSALFTMLWQSRSTLNYWLNPDPNADWLTRILTGETSEWVERGWRDLEAGLREIDEVCQAAGIGLHFVILPYRDQVSGRIPETAYNDRLRAIAQEMSVPIIDMLPPLREAYAEHGASLFIAWDGHNSAKANEVVAAEIAKHWPASESAPPAVTGRALGER